MINSGLVLLLNSSLVADVCVFHLICAAGEHHLPSLNLDQLILAEFGTAETSP